MKRTRNVEYSDMDVILPILELPSPCPVRIIVDDKSVRLHVGPRDWSWDLDGTLTGAGTLLSKEDTNG